MILNWHMFETERMQMDELDWIVPCQSRENTFSRTFIRYIHFDLHRVCCARTYTHTHTHTIQASTSIQLWQFMVSIQLIVCRYVRYVYTNEFLLCLQFAFKWMNEIEAEKRQKYTECFVFFVLLFYVVCWYHTPYRSFFFFFFPCVVSVFI